MLNSPATDPNPPHNLKTDIGKVKPNANRTVKVRPYGFCNIFLIAIIAPIAIGIKE